MVLTPRSMNTSKRKEDVLLHSIQEILSRLAKIPSSSHSLATKVLFFVEEKLKHSASYRNRLLGGLQSALGGLQDVEHLAKEEQGEAFTSFMKGFSLQTGVEINLSFQSKEHMVLTPRAMNTSTREEKALVNSIQEILSRLAKAPFSGNRLATNVVFCVEDDLKHSTGYRYRLLEGLQGALGGLKDIECQVNEEQEEAFTSFMKDFGLQ